MRLEGKIVLAAVVLIGGPVVVLLWTGVIFLIMETF